MLSALKDIVEAVAPMNAPHSSPTPDPGVRIMLSATPFIMVFPSTVSSPLLMEIFGVIVMINLTKKPEYYTFKV